MKFFRAKVVVQIVSGVPNGGAVLLSFPVVWLCRCPWKQVILFFVFEVSVVCDKSPNTFSTTVCHSDPKIFVVCYDHNVNSSAIKKFKHQTLLVFIGLFCYFSVTAFLSCSTVNVLWVCDLFDVVLIYKSFCKKKFKILKIGRPNFLKN